MNSRTSLVLLALGACGNLVLSKASMMAWTPPLGVKSESSAATLERALPSRGSGLEMPTKCILPGRRSLEVYGPKSAITTTTQVKLRSLPLTFPKDWFSPILLSPYSGENEQELVRWMGLHGLAPSPKHVKRILALEMGHMSGHTAPMASYDQSLLLAKFLLMAFVYDDDIAEVSQNLEEVLRPVQALAGQQFKITDPYTTAFSQIGDDYERLGATREWRQRFGQSMINCAYSAIKEQKIWADMAQAGLGAASSGPSFEELMTIRCSCAALEPMIMALEQVAGAELPLSVWEDRCFKELIATSETVCCIINDMFSVPKDLFTKDQFNHPGSNLVLFHQRKHEVSLLESMNAWAQLQDEAIQHYDELSVRVLRKLGPSSSLANRVRPLLRLIKECQVGLVLWQLRCKRYQGFTVAENGQAYRFHLEGR